MKPTDKAPEIENLLKQLTGGVSRRQAVHEAFCVWCRGAATEFKDEISRREFTVSGLCQTCQDSFFQ
jgi:hypothetical protein